MPKRILPLVETQIKNAKAKNKEYKMSDGLGLHLLITPSGGKLWRFQYRFDGKQKSLAFGSYPSISLADARRRREDARKLIANGNDPAAMKKELKDQEAAKTESDLCTFEVVGREWFSKNEPVWSPSHIRTVKSRLERDVYPIIGCRPIKEITRSEIISLVQRVEARGAIETADRIKIYCGQIFRYALNLEKIIHNPATDMRDVLTKREAGHHASITDPTQLSGLLRAIDGFTGTFVVKCALQLAPLFFVRPGELVKAEWSEFDLDSSEWNIPASKMKQKRPHLVPLSKQAIQILMSLHPVTGDNKYVFPSYRSKLKPMTNEALLAGLRRMGFCKNEMTVHGFRATARTILDEVLKFRIDFIEHQLAHAVKDPNGRAYNRTSHLEDRKEMMQKWSDYLDELKLIKNIN